jgi:N-acyl-D-aspartate/D-glutamate deacylase
LQKERLRDPQVRAELVAAEAHMKPRDNKMQGGGAATTDARKPDYANLYAMFDVDWNDPSIETLARAQGSHPVEVMIDLCLANENQVFVQPIVNELREDLLTVLRHEGVLATFSDSGAHVAQEMGSSLQSHLLHYWVGQRKAFSLEAAIRKLSFDNARAFGLQDRGLIAAGQCADLLLLEEGRVRPELPTVEYDLPGGARRLVQRAQGIHAVFVNGEQTLEDGRPTGAYPGRVLRAT